MTCEICGYKAKYEIGCGTYVCGRHVAMAVDSHAPLEANEVRVRRLPTDNGGNK